MVDAEAVALRGSRPSAIKISIPAGTFALTATCHKEDTMLPEFVLSFDLPGARPKQREAFNEVICENSLSAERKLRTVWRLITVEEDADALAASILKGVRKRSELGKAFAKDNLRMLVVLSDDNSAASISEHKTSVLESYPSPVVLDRPQVLGEQSEPTSHAAESPRQRRTPQRKRTKLNNS